MGMVDMHSIACMLTLYHPPSQKSTVYGRWKKTSLTAKLLGRATLILRYYVIRVLRIAVAASNHIVRIEFFVETTFASVFFLVFFLALHTDRVKERTVMVMSWTRTLLQGFLWPWTMVAVTWLTAMSVRGQLQSGRAPATRREGKLGRTRRRRWRGVGVWCREHVRWRREAALGQWRKEVRLSRSSLVRKSRSSVAMWEVKWTRIGYSKPREKSQETKALQKTTLQTSCSTSNERKYHPHVLGITWTAMNLEIDLCSKLDFLYTAVLNILSGFWQKLVVSSSAKRSITCYGSYERPCLRGYPWLLLFKGEQCCASPQETNGLKDMDGLLTAALFLSLTSMLSNRA